MDKHAQKRNIFDKINESTSIGGIAAENLFNPKFVKIMTELREDVDDPIRSILSGEKVGNAFPPDNTLSIKNYLKNAKENLAKREYINALGNIGRFHKSIESITHILSKFKASVDDIHEEFIQKDVDDDTKDEIRRLQGLYLKRKQQAQKAASASVQFMTKHAGMMDFLMGKERGMATWEKLYPKQFKKLREDLGVLLKDSNSLSSLVLSSLKDMAGFRATRKVGDYIVTGELIIKAFNNYDTKFDALFDAHHVLLEKITKNTKPETTTSVTTDTTDVKIPELNLNPVPVSSPVSIRSNPIKYKEPLPVSVIPPTENSPITEKPKTVNQAPIEEALNFGDRPTLESKVFVNPSDKIPPTLPPLGPLPTFETNTNHKYNKFVKILESMSNEHPLILAKFISKYASSIQNKDPVTAIKLFKMAKNIKG